MTPKDIAALAAAIVEAMRASVDAPAPVASSPAQAQAAAPVYVRDDLGTGRVCRCGHEHQRPVRSDLRARLATEAACHIKGCVSFGTAGTCKS